MKNQAILANVKLGGAEEESNSAHFTGEQATLGGEKVTQSPKCPWCEGVLIVAEQGNYCIDCPYPKKKGDARKDWLEDRNKCPNCHRLSLQPGANEHLCTVCKYRGSCFSPGL